MSIYLTCNKCGDKSETINQRENRNIIGNIVCLKCYYKLEFDNQKKEIEELKKKIKTYQKLFDLFEDFIYHLGEIKNELK